MDSPLAALMVVLASDSNEFKQVWLDVLEAAGCHVLTRLPPHSLRRKQYISLLCSHPHRPHYGSSPSICLSVPYRLLTEKSIEKRKLV